MKLAPKDRESGEIRRTMTVKLPPQIYYLGSFFPTMDIVIENFRKQNKTKSDNKNKLLFPLLFQN